MAFSLLNIEAPRIGKAGLENFVSEFRFPGNLEVASGYLAVGVVHKM